MNFPVLGVLAGLVFIVSGLAAIIHLQFEFLVILVLIAAGAALILTAVFGFRVRIWDLSLFIVGLIVLANVAGMNYYQTGTYRTTSFSVGSAYVNQQKIDVYANSGFGSISILFSSNADLAYQVVFSNAIFRSPFLNFGTNPTLTNETRDGILYLNATSGGSITITIGTKYETSINATTSVGSINMLTAQGPTINVQNISLVSGTGSIEAQIDSTNISQILLETGTGSINFASNYLATTMPRVPIHITSGTGSVNIHLKTASDVAVQINATSTLGSISQHLIGFTLSTNTNNHLVASFGNIRTATKSFYIKTSVGTGSINIAAQPMLQ